MEKVKKLFGEYKMTWKRLLIFSVICGLYTGAVLIIPGIKDTALKEIGIGYECWFILAIFVISNCKTRKEAILKCFIFFLISQPLVYLVQMPFVHRNLLADYYYPWFVKTIFTIPGSFVAYKIKKDNILGSIVLAVAGSFIGFSGVMFAIRGINNGAFSYILYGIFLVAAAIILGLIFLKEKTTRMVYFGIVLALTVLVNIGISDFDSVNGNYEIKLDSTDWYIDSGSFERLDAVIEGDKLKITYMTDNASGKVVIKNDNDEEIHFNIKIVDGSVDITKYEY